MIPLALVTFLPLAPARLAPPVRPAAVGRRPAACVRWRSRVADVRAARCRSTSASTRDATGYQFEENRAVDADARRRLSRRHRRHQPAARAAHDLPHAAGARLGAGTPIEDRVQGVRRSTMLAPRDGDARRLREPRPLPLLRLLGGDADPDVLHHRDLGRAATASTPRSSSSSTRWSAPLLMLVAILGLYYQHGAATGTLHVRPAACWRGA